MRILLLAVAALAAQWALGSPGLPWWTGEILVPMAGVVGLALRRHDRGWIEWCVVFGVGWDLVLSPVVGPGGIAWSATAVVLSRAAGIVADRSSRAWFVFGAAGTGVLLLVRKLTWLPLGLSAPLTWPQLLTAVALTGGWCGLLGWTGTVDPASRWRRWRARRLR